MVIVFKWDCPQEILNIVPRPEWALTYLPYDLGRVTSPLWASFLSLKWVSWLELDSGPFSSEALIWRLAKRGQYWRGGESRGAPGEGLSCPRTCGSRSAVGVNWCLCTVCGTCTAWHLILLLNSNNYSQYKDRNTVIEILEDAIKYKEKENHPWSHTQM